MVGEHEAGCLRIPSISAVEAAKSLGEGNNISVLLAGSGPSLHQAAAHASRCHPSISQVFINMFKRVLFVCGGCKLRYFFFYCCLKVIVADSEKFSYPLAEPWAKLIQLVQKKGEYSHIVAASDSFGKNVIARAAALLDVSPITDVISITGSNTFVRYITIQNLSFDVMSYYSFNLKTYLCCRPIYAGNALCTVKYSGVNPCTLTIRSTSFPVPSVEADSKVNDAPITEVDQSGFGTLLSSTVMILNLVVFL